MAADHVVTATQANDFAGQIDRSLRAGGITDDRLEVRLGVATPTAVEAIAAQDATGRYLAPKVKIRWHYEIFTIIPARGNDFRFHRWKLEVIVYGFAEIVVTHAA